METREILTLSVDRDLLVALFYVIPSFGHYKLESYMLWLTDTQTAVVAKEALEGHCIYDGGFCKLHLSYSRHTDLSIKVNNQPYLVN